MNVIDLNDWNVSYTTLVDWVEDSGADVYAVNSVGANKNSRMYAFTNEADRVAFELKFSRAKKTPDAGFYYCPYIPKHI